MEREQLVARDFFNARAADYRSARYAPDSGRELSYVLRQAIAMEFAGAPPAMVLDVGSGPGIFSEELSTRGFEVYSIDFSLNMLQAARQRADGVGWHLRGVNGDAARLPFCSEAFDVILCIGVVAYMPSLDEFLVELRRVLKPGGRLVIQTSNSRSPATLTDVGLRTLQRRLGPRLNLGDGFGGILRSYSRGRFRRALGRAGFHVAAERFYDFRPPLMDRLAPRWSTRLGLRLQALERSVIAPLAGEGFVVKAVAAS